MQSIEEVLSKSRACLGASHDRILKSSKSVRELRDRIESTATRVDQCQRLLTNGKNSGPAVSRDLLAEKVHA